MNDILRWAARQVVGDDPYDEPSFLDRMDGVRGTAPTEELLTRL